MTPIERSGPLVQRSHRAKTSRRRRRNPKPATRSPPRWKDRLSAITTDWPSAASSVFSRFSSPFLLSESFVRLLFGTLFGLAVAAIVGLGLTYYALTRGAAFGGLTTEGWTAWPKSGTTDADPYVRASIARSGRLPTALGDGVSFTVDSDDDGKILDGRCEVVVSGVTPVARFWTVTLYNADGGLVANSTNRYGFTSQEIVRHSDGSF